MSDLFTTLAREAAGVPMAVAPRGRSRFEVPPLPLNLASEAEEEAPAPIDTPPPRTASPRPKIRAEPQDSAVAQSPAQTPHALSHEPAHLVDVEDDPVSQIESGGEPKRAGRQPASQKPEPVRDAPEIARATLEPVHEPVKAASAFPAPASESARFAAVQDESDGLAPRALAIPPEAAVAPQRRAPPHVETIPPRIVVPESVKPDAAARTPGEAGRAQHSPALRRQAVSPPAVHVTIGRVEVRAVMPPPAAKPAPAAPKPVRPAMSLADYLEQRNRSG